jgi:hypothetical protein
VWSLETAASSHLMRESECGGIFSRGDAFRGRSSRSWCLSSSSNADMRASSIRELRELASGRFDFDFRGSNAYDVAAAEPRSH